MSYYRIEEWIPPENAIGGRGYWTALSGDRGLEYRGNEEEAFQYYRRLSAQTRKVRVVKVTAEVVS